jgi:hypothetical protein
MFSIAGKHEIVIGGFYQHSHIGVCVIDLGKQN